MGQQSISSHFYCIEVGLWLYIAEVSQLFGRHIGQRASHLTGHCYSTHARLCETLGKTEVRQLRREIGPLTHHQDVLVFEVAMDVASRVSVGECVKRLRDYRHRLRSLARLHPSRLQRPKHPGDG